MAPIVDHKNVNSAQSREKIAETSIGTRQGQIAEQRRRPCIECRISIPTRFLCQSAGDEIFPDAGRPEHEKVLVVPDPLRILRQSATSFRLQCDRS
jgi:hypothetical protein